MIDDFSTRIINWQHAHGRHDLPWQQMRSPYHVWLSEVMLQQTQVSTVIPYFNRFIEQFPTIKSLAQASLDQVMHIWSGLGYYTRARNLHNAAQCIAKQYKGVFPTDIDDIRLLPGIGPSTAGAIASLAHGQAEAILDGNVKRILARCFRVEGWPGKSSVLKKLWKLSRQLVPKTSTDTYNQGLMDLGSSICKRAKPLCSQCPISTLCLAHASNTTEQYPSKKMNNKPKRTEQRAFLLLINKNHEVLLCRRPNIGIWGGLWSVPEFELDNDIHTICQSMYGYKHYDISTKAKLSHQFSHYRLILHPTVIQLREEHMDLTDHVWYNSEQLPPGGIAAPITTLINEHCHDTHNIL